MPARSDSFRLNGRRGPVNPGNLAGTLNGKTRRSSGSCHVADPEDLMRPVAVLLLLARISALLTLGALTVLFTSAGQLTQDGQGLDLHGSGAVAIHISTGVLASVMAVRTWLTRTGYTPAVAAVVLFGLTFAQASLGSYMTLTMHVVGSLVVTLIAGWLTFWAFAPQKTAPAPTN